MVAERSTPSARVKALSSTKTPVEATHPNTFHHLQDSDKEMWSAYRRCCSLGKVHMQEMSCLQQAANS